MAVAAASLSSQHPQTLGGDRLYSIARWLLLALIYATATFVYGIALFPPTLDPFSITFWSYALLAIVSSGLSLKPRSIRLTALIYPIDLLWLSALALTGPGAANGYLPLLLLPLIGASLRIPRPHVLLLSMLAVGITIGVQFSSGAIRETSLFVSQALILGALPWLVSILSEQWAIDNRRRVTAADQQATQALAFAETYRSRMRALYEIALMFNRHSEPLSVLDTALNECQRVLPYRAAAIVLPTGRANEVQVIAGRGLSVAEASATFVIGDGVLGRVFRGADGGVLHNAHGAAELSAVASIQGCDSVLLLPLRSTQRTFGVALFGSDGSQITIEQMEMTTALISFGLIALQNAQLVTELRAERNNLLMREEEIRKQLNRDLHDGPAQALAAITMSLGFIRRLFDNESQRVPDELEKLKATAQRANHEVRTLLFELRPLALETQGLVPAIRQYLERFDPATGPAILFDGDDDIGPLTKRVQGTLFNIIQESVNNALKHAGAQHIWIRIAKRGDDLALKIQDDGKGFDIQAVKASYSERGSFGLLSLDERARLIGGNAEIVSAVGAGTTISVVVPLDQ